MRAPKLGSICERGKLWVLLRKWQATRLWGSAFRSGLSFRRAERLVQGAPHATGARFRTEAGAARFFPRWSALGGTPNEQNPFSPPGEFGFGINGRFNVSRNQACSRPDAGCQCRRRPGDLRGQAGRSRRQPDGQRGHGRLQLHLVNGHRVEPCRSAVNPRRPHTPRPKQ
jgi:hypothetical protein